MQGAVFRNVPGDCPIADADPCRPRPPHPPIFGKPISTRQTATAAVTQSDSMPMTFLVMRAHHADSVRGISK